MNTLLWNKMLIHKQVWFLQHNGGTSYQRTCNQWCISRFHKLANNAKISGIVSMVITRRYMITIKALEITFHTRIWHWESGIDSMCQDNLLKNVTMHFLKFFFSIPKAFPPHSFFWKNVYCTCFQKCVLDVCTLFMMDHELG